MRKVLTQTVEAADVSVEDSGRAVIVHVAGDDMDDSCPLFVKLQSWEDGCHHPEMKDIVGKRVTITIEIED